MARILSLDDEIGLLTIIQMILERAGHESLITTNEEEALSILRSQPIDLFTQDWHRFGMGGCEFLRVMKADENLCSIPVLLITAADMSEERPPEQLKAVGLDFNRDLAGYIPKPFMPDELLDTIEAILQ